MDFIEELKWRGMIHDMMPGTGEQLKKEMTSGYIGFDPSSDSLHIGNLAAIMLLKFFQETGHKPIVLVGGATGMIGDPSGKSEERNLLNEEVLRYNQEKIKIQLEKFLDFSDKPNGAVMVNNYDWMKEFSYLDFLRDIGKHLTINYMIAKDSVKSRMESGISYTEFSYQLVQGYDFLNLYENHNCKLQMGGSDQWGNIVTGTELIRRMNSGSAYALTCPLITKSDGGKFGKTEEGNIWLDPKKTSPYKFYQFWLNTSDDDSVNYIKVFTLLTKEEIIELVKQHRKSPHERLLQKTLAKEITIRVHSEKDYDAAVEASSILFGKGTAETLANLPEDMFLSVFEGVPHCDISRDELKKNISVLDLLTMYCSIFPSKGEARRMLKDGGVQINKHKVNDAIMVKEEMLINNKYLLVQKGKKNYFLVRVV
ncbi:MAG: tyrosine--tRNA ligase [Bacteroidales bacterium]|nr:tyrosine--tRNA ligase [Bacteroidales bacterium]